MSEDQDRPRESAGEPRATHRSVWTTRIVLGLLLVILGLIGLALEDFAPDGAQWYWVGLIPVFCIIGILNTWRQRKAGQALWPSIRHQVYHWVGLLLAFQVMLMLIHTGTLDRNSAGLVSLLLLSLSSFSAGVAYDRSFLLVGVLLALAALSASYVEEYMWIVLTCLMVIIVLLLVLRRFAPRRTPQVP